MLLLLLLLLLLPLVGAVNTRRPKHGWHAMQQLRLSAPFVVVSEWVYATRAKTTRTDD
jgi:hypothetical protein